MHPVNPLGIGTRDVRFKGKGTRGDHELVKGLPPFFLCVELTYMDPSPLQVELGDLVEDAGIDIALLPEGLRGQGNEGMYIVDNPADVVGDPSRRIRGMRAALKDDDLQVRSLPAGLRGSGHPRCITADYHQSLFFHTDVPPCENETTLFKYRLLVPSFCLAITL
jgi:hypothetical protein